MRTGHKPNKTIICCIATLLVLAQAIYETASASDGAHYNGFNIKQLSCYLGDVDVDVCEAGAKISSRKGTLVALCPAPFDKICIYNSKNHKIFVTAAETYKNYLSNQFNVMLNTTFGDAAIVLHKSTSIVVRGEHCDRYMTNNQFAQVQTKNYRLGLCSHESPRFYDMATSQRLLKNNSLAWAIDRIFGLPTSPGMPINATYINMANETTTALRTVIPPKVASFKASDFQCPKGYTIAKDQRELSVDPKSSDDVMPLF